MAVRIRRNSKPLDGITRTMTGLGRLRVKAGAMKGQRRERSGEFGMSNAAMLAIHEFGTDTVPAREPVKTGLRKGARAVSKIWAKRVELIHRGTSGGDAAAEAMGEIMVKSIKKGIRTRLPPALSEATKAKKGRDKRMVPLLDTKQIHDSIEAKVENR